MMMLGLDILLNRSFPDVKTLKKPKCGPAGSRRELPSAMGEPEPVRARS